MTQTPEIIFLRYFMSYVGRCESAYTVFLPRANIHLKHAEWTTECATKGSTFYHQGG